MKAQESRGAASRAYSCPPCFEYFCCKVILRPTGGAQTFAPLQNGLLPATCRARLRTRQISDAWKSDEKLIGRIFRVLAKRDQYVEGQKQRLPWRGPSLQRAEDRCVCSNTVIDECVAQDKNRSASVGSIFIRKRPIAARAAAYRTCSVCGWSVRRFSDRKRNLCRGAIQAKVSPGRRALVPASRLSPPTGSDRSGGHPTAYGLSSLDRMFALIRDCPGSSIPYIFRTLGVL